MRWFGVWQCPLNLSPRPVQCTRSFLTAKPGSRRTVRTTMQPRPATPTPGSLPKVTRHPNQLGPQACDDGKEQGWEGKGFSSRLGCRHRPLQHQEPLPSPSNRRLPLSQDVCGSRVARNLRWCDTFWTAKTARSSERRSCHRGPLRCCLPRPLRNGPFPRRTAGHCSATLLLISTGRRTDLFPCGMRAGEGRAFGDSTLHDVDVRVQERDHQRGGEANVLH